MLIYDRRNELQGQATTHALIVGISKYPEFSEGSNLTSAARSAYSVYKWLTENYHRPATPLATCRLMLAPSKHECENPEIKSLASPCKFNDFVVEVSEWRNDAKTHKENVTFFYFAGHGFARSIQDSLIAFSDFGDDIGGALRAAVSVNNIVYGMAPTERQENIARLQLFFIDTSRITLNSFQAYEVLSPSQVFDVNLNALDDRRAVVFHAASHGGYSFAYIQGLTFFSRSLIECLEGKAIDPGVFDQHGQQSLPCVTINSLIRGLEADLNKQSALLHNAKQTFTVGGLVRDDVIHYPVSIPKVKLIIEVEPAEALPLVQIHVKNPEGTSVLELQDIQSNPYETLIDAGIYSFQVQIQPKHPEYSDQTKILSILPTEFHWKVKVKD